MSDMELDLQLNETTSSPVDEERVRIREEYRLRLAEKLKDPAFRNIEGFPIGTDEAIIALSDPPYYTACPNPFIDEWLQTRSKPYDSEADAYHREPFAADVSEGKNDPIYNAHSYHTKVPHKAIMRYILHYTEPGDVVYDGFSGSGMTGVAAQMCATREQVESLGYRVLDDHSILGDDGKPFSRLGSRSAILNDLAPIATFIAYNYNTPVDSVVFGREAKRILSEVEKECGWMYSTLHEANDDEVRQATEILTSSVDIDDLVSIIPRLSKLGKINFTVWSDVFTCSHCGGDIVFYYAAIDAETGTVKENFICPVCGSETTKRECKHATEAYFDQVIGKTIHRRKQVPVLINYTVAKKRYTKQPDSYDLLVLDKISQFQIPYWFPTNPMMGKGIDWGDLWRAGYHIGISHVHHFYFNRSLWVLSALIAKSKLCEDARLSASLRFLFGQWAIGLSKLNRYSPHHFSQNNRNLSGTLYVGSQIAEVSPTYAFTEKLERLIKAFRNWPSGTSPIICCQSTTSNITDTPLVDYIFTDPPFGGNLPYSELNYLWESWMGVQTNTLSEAITSESQAKGLYEYGELMRRCFSSYFNVLKPGRWMTVEFHNSANSVWNAIQEALWSTGFVVADIRVLDKESKTKKQITGNNAVNVDLVISCYKPRADFEARFASMKGESQGAIWFVRQHLDMLPVAPITKDGHIEVVAERTRYMLFDRMVAYHLQHGARIPVSAAEFYQILNDQFVERDEMYFLQDQAARYDALRSRSAIEQLAIFIRDERSAVQWTRVQLLQQSQTLGDLTPKFMQETRDWDAREPRPELRDLLKENFILDEDGKWRVPDPNQEKDLEALRRKGLLRTFEGYVKLKGQLKVFRKEAILEGFKHCWQTKQFGVIVAVCESIPVKILQEVPEFVQFYDIAKDLAPAETVQLEFTWEG